ncbi:hypothetical protein AURDEDRAFT_163612 [Auricularia subglabra TFB-10046 SS5]|nr:hypothetical protein AURDEDRAFT_163612 [Auricularia subglabra TFB-10046 SS5]
MTHNCFLVLLEAEFVRAELVLVMELVDASVNELGGLSSQPFEALDQRKLAWAALERLGDQQTMPHPFVLLLLEPEVVRAEFVLVLELVDVSVNKLCAPPSLPFEALDQRKLAWAALKRLRQERQVWLTWC